MPSDISLYILTHVFCVWVCDWEESIRGKSKIDCCLVAYQVFGFTVMIKFAPTGPCNHLLTKKREKGKTLDSRK